MVCICFPLLLIFSFAGIFGSGAAFDTASLPVREEQEICVGGTVYRQDWKEKNQSLYLKNISIYSEPDKTAFDAADFLPERSKKKTFKIKVYLKKAAEVHLGEYVLVTGEAAFLRPASNPGGFDEQSFYGARGILLQLKRAEVKKKDGACWPLRNAVNTMQKRLTEQLKKTMEEPEAGILCAILLGEKSSLEAEIKDLYRDAGMIHLLAISGLHITMLGMGLYRLLRKSGLSIKWSVFFCWGLMLVYVFMTGMAYSAVRAYIMFAMYLLAHLTGRTYDLPTALAVAAVTILYGADQAVTQAGFLLSFGAVSGILLGSGFQSERLKKSGLGISLGIQIMTTPLTAYFYYQIPLYGVLVNLLVIPLMPLVLGFGIAGMTAGFFLPAVGKMGMAPAGFLVFLMGAAAKKVQGLPFSNLVVGKPPLFLVILYYPLLLAGFFLMDKKIKKNRKIDLIKLSFAIILLSGILGISGEKHFRMTFLDVGQGDGCCIENDGKSVWMIDGGSSSETGLARYTLEPFLKSSRISHVDGWLISHYDMDHVSGLLEILEDYRPDLLGRNSGGITVGQIVLPDIRTDSPMREQICSLAAKYEIPVRYVSDGDVLKEEGMTLRILAPEKTQNYGSENAASMVVLVQYRDVTVLMTGDLEKDGEEYFLIRHPAPDVDILKAAHHGSRYATSERFLRAVKPEAAVISCGRNNAYGHPARELLLRLFQENCAVTRTDRQGAVILDVEKGKWSMRGYLR